MMVFTRIHHRFEFYKRNDKLYVKRTYLYDENDVKIIQLPETVNTPTWLLKTEEILIVLCENKNEL
jgi:hypothetical protein